MTFTLAFTSWILLTEATFPINILAQVTSVYFAVRNYWRGFFAAVCGAVVFRQANRTTINQRSSKYFLFWRGKGLLSSSGRQTAQQLTSGTPNIFCSGMGKACCRLQAANPQSTTINQRSSKQFFSKMGRFAGFHVKINIFFLFSALFLNFLWLFCVHKDSCVNPWNVVNFFAYKIVKIQINFLNFAGYFTWCACALEGCSPSGSRMKKPLLQYSGQQPAI